LGLRLKLILARTAWRSKTGGATIDSTWLGQDVFGLRGEKHLTRGIDLIMFTPKPLNRVGILAFDLGGDEAAWGA
jgi:hypothetical protein